MEGIKLDLRKLLGFKIIANDQCAAVLHSPKIGAKGCSVEAGTPVAGGALMAKVGIKNGFTSD